MAKVCVIIGADSAIGLEAARCLTKDKIIVLAGKKLDILESGRKGLQYTGYTAYAIPCTPSDLNSVKRLAEFASQLGEVKSVIDCVGTELLIEGTPEEILRAHVLKSVYVNEEFSKIMKTGGAIVDVCSHYAYERPAFLLPKRVYAVVDKDEEKLLAKLVKRSSFFKDEAKQRRVAYVLAQNFVIWYAKKCAFAYGMQGIRVVSVSLGAVCTGMEEEQTPNAFVPFSAEERMGTPEEIGYLLSTIADERNGYLTGVDILCDGGSINGKKTFKKNKKK